MAEREADVIGNVTNKMRRAVKILPEQDETRPLASRILARQERLTDEERDGMVAVSRERYGKMLEDLWREAIDESRVLDAEFYLKSLKQKELLSNN